MSPPEQPSLALFALDGGGEFPGAVRLCSQATVARLPDILRAAWKLGRVGSSESRVLNSLASNNKAAVFSRQLAPREEKRKYP